jgi:hypothetical protein
MASSDSHGSAPRNGRNGTFTRATFVTIAVFALNAYYSVNNSGAISEIGLVGLLLAGGFNVGSFFDK